MPCKVVFFYQMYENGWSETFYHSADNPNDVRDQITNQLLTAAIQFRYNACFLTAVRISSYNVNPHKHLLYRSFPNMQGTRTKSQLEGSDVTTTADVQDLIASQDAGVRRSMYIRGLLDDDVLRDQYGNEYESPTLKQGIKSYVGYLSRTGLSIKTLVNPPDGGLLWTQVFKIDNIGTLSSQTRANVYCTPFGATVGDYIRFKGIPPIAKGFPRVARILETTVGGSPSYTIGWSVPGGGMIPCANMYATVFKTALYSIGSSVFTHFREHKTGRPFGLARGRKSAGARISR